MSDPNCVVVEPGPVTVLRLNRPDKRNAIDSAMYTALTAALRAADADEAVRAVIVYGGDRCFSAGNDVSEFLSTPPAGEEAPVFGLLRALTSVLVPLIAAVEGPAVGIGATLLLHCDYVAAAETAKLRFPFTALGVVPEAASTLLLPRTVGRLAAHELLLFGESIDAPRAHALGLVSALTAPGAALSAARARAEALTALPRGAVRATKALLRAPDRPAVETALRAEADEFVRRLTSDEAREAFLRFLAPRAAPSTG